MEEILARQEQIERDMVFRHPWVPFYYNWVIAVTVVALFISFVIWGLDIRTERRAADMTATARAAWEAQLQAEADAKEEELAQIRASQEHIMTEEAKVIAKAFYGIRNFDDKYGYTASDFETYARCIFNRADATGDSIEAVVSKKDQFLGYSEKNQLVKEYYDMAIRFVDEWHQEEVKPCDIRYQFALLDDDGIWLVKNFNADGKERRWQAG